MSFQSDARTYLQQLAVNLKDASDTDEATAELSFRSALDAFLRKVFIGIAPTAAVILEPKRRLTGAPDFRVHDTASLGVFGFIEAKGPELQNRLDSSFLKKHNNQIERYRSLGYRVMVTDGLDFFLYEPDVADVTSASLVNKPVDCPHVASASINAEIYDLFAKFLSTPTFRLVGEQGLVELTAKHAREIARVVTELTPLAATAAVDEPERKTIERLHSVHATVADHLDPHLKCYESFGGFVAQVLAFSLLFAHRVEHRNATSARELYNLLVKWGRPGTGRSENQLRPFRELIKLLGDELEPGCSGDLGRIYDTLRTTLAYVALPMKASESPEYHTLYETFLEQFDSTLRDRYGAYYTPKTVAEACVRLTISATGFKGAPHDKVIEPCCGTGSFIDALQVAGIPSPITGLEVLPSAYALACFRQSMVQNTKSTVQIVLTNTMADDLLTEEVVTRTGQPSLFEMERSEARAAIRPPIVLVIGNPPAKDVSTSDEFFCSQIYSQLDSFRPPVHERSGRANDQKQTTSTAMQFLRWSAERVLRNGSGTLSLLLPASFINKPSYKIARRWLKQHFGKIWILEIDGDARAGSRSNIFAVQQGRSLVIAQIHDVREVHHASIANLTKQEKIAWLANDASKLLKEFTVLPEDPGRSALTPIAAASADWNRMTPLWSKCEASRAIFLHQCSGIKLAPTAAFVNMRLQMLKRRLLDLAKYASSVSEYIEKWFAGQTRRPAESKFTPVVQKLILASASVDGEYQRYALRPFVTCWALISERVLKSLASQPSSGTRYRPEHLVIFSDHNNVAIGITPTPDDVSDDLGRPCVLLRHLPDNDLSRRGNIRVLAARSPGNKHSAGWGNLHSNVHPWLEGLYGTAATKLGLATEEAIVLYCYAVLSTQWFLDEWHDQLNECTGDNLPRVPLPEDAASFSALVNLGSSLDKVENIENFEMEPNALEGFSEFRLKSHRIEPNGELALLDESNVARWHIAGFGQFSEFEVGGYGVIREMVKWLSFKYMRADLTSEDVRNLYHLKQVLETHHLLQDDLKLAVKNAISSPQVTLAG